MDDWTAGYVADIGYTYGYYTELNPLYARLALTSAGYAVPQIETACELGFGQGVAVNFHAAAFARTRWWGTDFNPAHASFAQELARASGTGARLFDDAFEDFCNRSDVPDMDYISLHGIWSWVSDRNRDVLVDFIRRKLKPGGILYNSYNVYPGWASQVPLRDLLVQYADSMAAPGQGTANRIDASINFAKRFFAASPRYAKFNPQAVERLKNVETQNRNYIAHEYFNKDWAPMPFSKVASMLGGAKLTFACSAALIEHVDSLYLSPEQLAIIKETQDPVLQQTLRDFCINQHFRKDYWIKGPRRLNQRQYRDALDSLRFVLIRRVADVKLVVPGVQPELKLAENIYSPVLDALSDHKPKSLQELLGQVAGKGVTPAQLLQAMVILSGKSDVMPVQSDEEVAAAREPTRKLNEHLMKFAAGDHSVPYLVSPLTGSAVGMSRFQQMFLDSYVHGVRTPEEWVKKAWQELSSIGQRLAKDGKTLTTPAENVAELTKQATDLASRMDLMKALGII
jgi:SAM-dependent methyltransferase